MTDIEKRDLVLKSVPMVTDQLVAETVEQIMQILSDVHEYTPGDVLPIKFICHVELDLDVLLGKPLLPQALPDEVKKLYE